MLGGRDRMLSSPVPPCEGELRFIAGHVVMAPTRYFPVLIAAVGGAGRIQPLWYSDHDGNATPLMAQWADCRHVG